MTTSRRRSEPHKYSVSTGPVSVPLKAMVHYLSEFSSYSFAIASGNEAVYIDTGSLNHERLKFCAELGKCQ